MLQQINLQAATVTFHGENADQVKVRKIIYRVIEKRKVVILFLM